MGILWEIYDAESDVGPNRVRREKEGRTKNPDSSASIADSGIVTWRGYSRFIEDANAKTYTDQLESASTRTATRAIEGKKNPKDEFVGKMRRWTRFVFD